VSRAPAESYRLALEHQPDDEDVRAVQSGLNAFNTAQSGVAGMHSLAAFIRDADGRILGGVGGRTWGEVLDVRLVWVHDDLPAWDTGGSCLRRSTAILPAIGSISSRKR